MGKSSEEFLKLRENEEKKFLKSDTSDLLKVLSNIKNMVLNGSLEPLQAFIKFKQVNDHIKLINEEIKDMAIEQAEKFKGQIYLGYNPRISERKTYSYDHIPEWIEQNKKIKEIEENAKKVYLITKGNDIVDAETGEVKKSALIKSVTNVLTLEKAK